MTKEDLEAAFDLVRSWPPERQQLAVWMLRGMDTKQPVYALSDEERAAVRRGLDDSANRRFASKERIANIFGRPVR